MAAGILVNAGITYGLLTAIDGLTLSFNPILFYLLCGGVNASTSVLTMDKKRSPQTNIMLGGSKFIINMSVNGSLIGEMGQKVAQSNNTVASIRQSIENYESGFKQQDSDYGLIIGLTLATAVFIAWLFGRGK